MPFLLITLAVAVGIALVTGGTLRQILETRLQATWVLFIALGLQFVVDGLRPQASGAATVVGAGLLVASYVLLLGFCVANLRLKGMAVVAVGIALNGAVITVNRGMPIRTRFDVAATAKHHAERPSDRLMPLADIIVVPPLNQALSFGDLIMVVGLVDVLVHRSRAASLRRRPGPSQVAAPA